MPGFNEPKVGVGAKVALFFRQLAAEKPFYRTNWLLVPEAGLDPMHHDLTTARDEGGYLPLGDVGGAVAPRDLHLRVEFQSVARLPETGLILFTLHSYSDPLPSLARAPKAAAVLRLAVRALDGAKRRYLGMTETRAAEVAAYLGRLAGKWR